jgi:ATP-binding cassette subfamily C protein CydD
VGLSGGEALRLALARIAVTPSADLILADEPTAHLDIDTAQEITTGLLRLAVGRTLVLATHDPALASRMDRIVRLEPQSLSEAA